MNPFHSLEINLKGVRRNEKLSTRQAFIGAAGAGKSALLIGFRLAFSGVNPTGNRGQDLAQLLHDGHGMARIGCASSAGSWRGTAEGRPEWEVTGELAQAKADAKLGGLLPGEGFAELLYSEGPKIRSLVFAKFGAMSKLDPVLTKADLEVWNAGLEEAGSLDTYAAELQTEVRSLGREIGQVSKDEMQIDPAIADPETLQRQLTQLERNPPRQVGDGLAARRKLDRAKRVLAMLEEMDAANTTVCPLCAGVTGKSRLDTVRKLVAQRYAEVAAQEKDSIAGRAYAAQITGIKAELEQAKRVAGAREFAEKQKRNQLEERRALEDKQAQAKRLSVEAQRLLTVELSRIKLAAESAVNVHMTGGYQAGLFLDAKTAYWGILDKGNVRSHRAMSGSQKSALFVALGMAWGVEFLLLDDAEFQGMSRAHVRELLTMIADSPLTQVLIARPADCVDEIPPGWVITEVK
jgi:ABC-type branched-subunit amino acid transport system ATPase component